MDDVYNLNVHLQPNKKQPEGPPNLLIIVVSAATGTVVLGEYMHTTVLQVIVVCMRPTNGAQLII